MRRVAALSVLAALLGGCGVMDGRVESTTFAEVGDTLASDAPSVDVECGPLSRDDCEQAVSAIVNGLPVGDDVVAIELRELDGPLAVTPVPPWSASASVTMDDGFVYELVIIQETRPGPMEINFAPDS